MPLTSSIHTRYNKPVTTHHFYEGEHTHVGYRMHYSKRGLLPAGHRLHHRLQPARHERNKLMIETLLLGLVTVALLVYLVYALLRPENF